MIAKRLILLRVAKNQFRIEYSITKRIEHTSRPQDSVDWARGSIV